MKNQVSTSHDITYHFGLLMELLDDEVIFVLASMKADSQKSNGYIVKMTLMICMVTEIVESSLHVVVLPVTQMISPGLIDVNLKQ